MFINKNVKNIGVGRMVENYEQQVKFGRNLYDYQILKVSEIKKIRVFGLEFSKLISIGFVVVKSLMKVVGVYFEMNKVLKNYLNLEKIKKK